MITPAMSRKAALAMADARLDPDQQAAVLDAARKAGSDAGFAAAVKDLLPGL